MFAQPVHHVVNDRHVLVGQGMSGDIWRPTATQKSMRFAADFP